MPSKSESHSQEQIELALIPPSPKHAEVWATWRSEPLTQRFNPLKEATLEDLRERLSMFSCDLSDRSHLEYRWMVDYNDTVIGTVALSSPSWGMGYAEIAYMLGEDFHGRGLGTRAVALLIDMIFRETNLARLFANISCENTASQRLVERLGFTREGVMREHFIIQGRRVDEFIYGLLRREWKPLEAFDGGFGKGGTDVRPGIGG